VKLSMCSLCWLSCALVPLLPGCTTDGVEGSSGIAQLPITGTVFTIVLENHDEDVVEEDMSYLESLAQAYARAGAYFADHHPSLPNYLLMTSGRDHGVEDDDGPDAHPIDGNENLADQLDAAGITWRAYMEGMGEPCKTSDGGDYAVRHNPFVYYTSLSGDVARCQEHIVDMSEHFSADLEADAFRYMWIAPDLCNDMHDCDPGTTDAWLGQVVPQILESKGYQDGGAILFLWDEGGGDLTYVFGGDQTIPFVLVSEDVVSPGFVSDILYSHDSYLATIEDAFEMPRLPATVDSTPMADFFGAPQRAP
jgi:hypothetical protein